MVSESTLIHRRAAAACIRWFRRLVPGLCSVVCRSRVSWFCLLVVGRPSISGAPTESARTSICATNLSLQRKSQQRAAAASRWKTWKTQATCTNAVSCGSSSNGLNCGATLNNWVAGNWTTPAKSLRNQICPLARRCLHTVFSRHSAIYCGRIPRAVPRENRPPPAIWFPHASLVLTEQPKCGDQLHGILQKP